MLMYPHMIGLVLFHLATSIPSTHVSCCSSTILYAVAVMKPRKPVLEPRTENVVPLGLFALFSGYACRNVYSTSFSRQPSTSDHLPSFLLYFDWQTNPHIVFTTHANVLLQRRT